MPPSRPAPVAQPKKIVTTATVGVLMLATAWATFQQRHRIVAHVPGAARVYAALGTPVNLDRLVISEVRGRIMQEGPERYLAVEGSIANPDKVALQVPRVHLSIRSPDGRSIYQWTADPGPAKLKPGESTVFRARLAAPPPGGQDVSARFVGAGG